MLISRGLVGASRFVLTAAVVAVSSGALAQAGDVSADAQTAQPSVVVNYRARPRYPYDPQRLKLRPTLDGELRENEWSPLYTVSDGPVQGTVYLNWDDEYLYIAARTSRPAWVVVNIDATADGWLRSADNLELTYAPLGASVVPPVSARVLDAAGNRDAPVWDPAAVDTKSIPIVVKQAGADQVLETAIPRGLAGLVLRNNAQLSFRADFLPASVSPAPTAPYEPHLLLDVTLVQSSVVAAPGVVPRLTLEDSGVVPGQTLRATLELSNQVDETRRIESVTWSGVGAAERLLKSLREVALPPVPGLKTQRLRYATPIPDTAIPGFYQLTVTATLDNGATVASTVSFSVEEAFAVQLEADPPAVTLLGPTPVKLTAVVSSAAQGFKRADVLLSAPASWEVKGNPKRSVNLHRENSVARVPFQITIPSATQAGEFAVNVTVSWRGRTWQAHRIVKVTRPAQSN